VKGEHSTANANSAKDKAYKLADGGGLYLEVMPTGTKLWRTRSNHYFINAPQTRRRVSFRFMMGKFRLPGSC
jgi:hypothetical protein